MAVYEVTFSGNTAKKFRADKTLAEVKQMVKAAKATGELLQAAPDILINPETICEIKKLKD